MPVFSVDTAAVAATAARLRARMATIQSEADAMNADLGVLQSSWTGSASASMASCAADWHVTQAHVQASLDAIGQALDASALAYDEAESLNAGRFGAAG